MVDTVSRNGEHKVLAIWKYDKREANHAPFVYFGIDAKGGIGEAEEAVIAYACGCLDALGWQWVLLTLRLCSSTAIMMVMAMMLLLLLLLRSPCS